MPRPPPAVQVSDHAVLRYLERVGGFDIERLRAEISERVSEAYIVGITGIVIDGFSYRIGASPTGAPIVTTVLRPNAGLIRPKGANEQAEEGIRHG